MKISTSIIFGMALTAFISSCAYNKSDKLELPEPGGDQPVVTYTNFVKTMIDSNHCLQCHVPGNTAGAPWDYSTYNGIRTVALSGALKTRAIDRIGSNPMPQGFPALSQANRDTLQMWIDQGALE